MGAVFEATDETTGTTVAIKLLRPEYVEDSAMRRRFRREAAVLKALDHPAIVKVLEVGVDDNNHIYMVSELVTGTTLREKLQEGPIEQTQLRAWMVSICEGMRAAHEHGVLHADLKPDNIVVIDGDGAARPKIVDFGTSKIVGLERLTATGELAGTPAYMAPEFLTGKGTIDERVDVYALGVVAYEALCGAPPFAEKNPGKLLFRIAAGDALPLDARADVSANVARVVHRAMHPDVEQRYPGMLELADAWRRCVPE